MYSLWSQDDDLDGAFRLRRQGGRLHVIYPAGRYRTLAAVCLVLGITAALLALLLPPMGAGTGTIRLAFGIFAAVLALTGLALPFSALELVVDRRQLRVVRAWGGYPFHERRLRTQAVTGVEIEQAPTGFLVFCSTDGGRLVLFAGLAERQEAEALRSEFLAASGLSRARLHCA